MTRRLILLCATLVALASEAAYGVGLGALELNSALNQRFDAEIELTNVRNLEPEEILANLASQEDFERVGVERTYVLTDLRFNVQRNENGNLFLKVTSSRPVIEPYLNFIVEVLWPSGRILREYTVLLDPPVFGQEGVEPIRPSSTARPPRETVRREEPAPREAPRPAPTPSQTRQQPEGPRLADEGMYQDGEYGMTGPGDTMWAIALKVRPDNSVSVQQTMLAIQRANPKAFINNNINLLKAGHVLRIPDEQEIRELTRENAIAEVKIHNEEFDLYKSGADVAQLDATRRQREPAADTGEETGELKLLTSGEASGERAGAGGGSERTAELEADLAVAKEDLDRTNRANTELNGRIADLESQIEDLNALIEAKDNQLATLQNQLKKMLEQQPAQPAPQPVQRATSDSLLTNPFVLGGLGLLLIGGLAGGMIFMRNRRQSATLEEDDFSDMTVDEDVAEAQEDGEGESTPEVDAEEIDEELAPQTSDAISEVEIYIAYGRFPQAITFLQNAIEAEPERTDLRLKLLEVYVQTEDATAFNLEFEKLKELGDDEAIARGAELQQQIPGAAETAEAAMDATVVSSAPVAAIDEPSDDDDDLSFDLDDLDSETEDEDLDLGGDLDLDDDTDNDLDLDLDLDEEDDESGVTADLGETADADDDLDLDLDDDLELDDVELDLDDDDSEGASADDTTELNLDSDDDADALDLGELDDSDDDDALDLSELDDSDDDDALDLSDLDDSDDDDALDLSALDDSDDDDALDLGDLDDSDDDDVLDLGDMDDDDSELDLGDFDDDDNALDLSDAEGLDDDDLELDLDEDAGTKLDLARAYIDMGDNEGARNVLEEVVKEGSETEVKEANELLEKID